MGDTFIDDIFLKSMKESVLDLMTSNYKLEEHP